MMDVEYNRFSVIPLVLQMREGADAVDLGILQKRVSKYPPPKPFGLTADLPLIDVSSPWENLQGHLSKSTFFVESATSSSYRLVSLASINTTP